MPRTEALAKLKQKTILKGFGSKLGVENDATAIIHFLVTSCHNIFSPVFYWFVYVVYSLDCAVQEQTLCEEKFQVQNF